MLFPLSRAYIQYASIPVILANSPPFDPNNPAHNHPNTGILWLLGGALLVIALALVILTVGTIMLIVYLAKRRRTKTKSEEPASTSPPSA